MPTTPPAPLPAPGPDQPAGPPIPDGFAPAAPSWRPAALLAVLAVVSVGGWWLLHRWYGLLENRNNTHFSFERIPGGFDSDTMRLTALILLVLAAAFWATILVLQRLEATPRQVALSVIAMAAGGAVVNVLLYPVGALDVFNYMVELKLAYHYGENPYLSTFAAYRESDPFALPAFLVEITLFYGPAWLLVMWAPMAFTGFSDVIDTLIALKVFNVALIALAGFLIARYQRDHRLRWLAAALFVANPLVLFEGVANGHNDVLLTVFVIGAVLALERRSPLAGPLLALSALVKLYTAALIPIFIVVALREHWGWRRIATTVALTAIAVVVTCAPYWGDGKLVDGLRAGLEESQEMDHVSLLSLAQQYEQEQVAKEHMDPTFARERPSVEIVPQETQDALHRWFTVTFVALALLIAASVWRGRPPELAAAETLLLLYLLMTNLYPWYLITVFAVLALRPDRLGKLYIAIATALGLVYYPMFIFGHYNSGWTRFEIHQFLALFLTVPILLYLAARVVTWRRTVADASAREPWRPALPRWRVDLPGNPELPDRSR